MIRNTFAITALLGLQETQALQISSHQKQKSTTNISHQTNENTSELQVSTSISTTMETGCWDGIKRWSATSDSWTVFKDAHAQGASQFEDQSFGATETSLFNTNYLSDDSDANSMKAAIKAWKRPSEMDYGDGKPSLWGPTNQPIPQGVKQQNLGDCWFLAAASAVSEVPLRLKRVVWNDSYDEKGAFRFHFWVKNKWESINIDDRLPTKQNWNNQWRPWATTRSTKGAWWMPLMEKAYAKLDQNYERIIAGMGYEGLRTLTGMPVTYIKLNKGIDLDASWNELKPLTGKNFPMTTPCCNGGNLNGLVSGHAYTLLDLVQLSTGEKLAKVRNPWSSGEYKGDWSDNSNKWTDALKKEVNLTNANDGIFFLPFKMYAEQYWGASVALYQPYKYKQIDVEQKERTVTYTLTNPSDQEMYVVGETYSDRNFPRTCKANNNYVLYLYNSNNEMVGKYGYIGWSGWGFVGKAGQKLPKGTYKILLVNQVYSTQAAHVTLNFYWRDQAGTATVKS